MNIPLLLIGIVFIILGFISLKKSQHLNKNGIKTLAKVVKVEKVKSQDEDGYTKYSYRPLLSFKDENQVEHEFKSDVSSGNKRKYHEGDEIEIVYDPENSEKAMVKNFFSMWLMPVILGGIGIMIFIVGLSS